MWLGLAALKVGAQQRGAAGSGPKKSEAGILRGSK
jgi:hypothetical protein